MKHLILLVTTLISINTSAQRYLTYVYPNIDSIIGGVYGTAVDYQSVTQNLLYDFYSPSSDTALKRPLIIYIHGGGFNSGSRTLLSVKLLCRKMAMKGYAVANIDYRLDPAFDIYNSNSDRRAMTDAMHDAKQAIRYFKANAASLKLDTNKIFIGGESAGAITSMMATYVDKQSEMAVYPLANPNNPIGSTSNSTYGNAVQGTMCLCGLIIDTTAIENASNPPILWTHGSADPFIPISLAFNIVLRASHIGLPIQTKVYYGATHCPWYYSLPNWQLYLDSTITDITTFLYPKVSTITGINNEEHQIVKSIFPNPATDFVNIDLDKQYSDLNVTVFSNTGQLINKLSFDKADNIQLDLKSLDDGLYLIKVEQDNKIILSKRIIIFKK